MIPQQVDKIIFTGPVGAGKTTAITAISDAPPVHTDVGMSEAGPSGKSTTTVAMDYAFISLDNGQRVHLYGTPGQSRFDFMWEILCRDGIGLVLLIDNSSPDPLADMDFYLDAFAAFIAETGVVIGITRMDVANRVSLDDYQSRLHARGQIHPLFEVDARSSQDVKILVHALLAVLSFKE